MVRVCINSEVHYLEAASSVNYRYFIWTKIGSIHLKIIPKILVVTPKSNLTLNIIPIAQRSSHFKTKNRLINPLLRIPVPNLKHFLPSLLMHVKRHHKAKLNRLTHNIIIKNVDAIDHKIIIIVNASF